MTKHIITRTNTPGSLASFTTREATRILPYKALTFAACPNRKTPGGRILSYDLVELSTGLKVDTLRKVTECRQWLLEHFTSVIRVMMLKGNQRHIYEMMNHTESADALPHDIDYSIIFKALAEAGIINTSSLDDGMRNEYENTLSMF